MINGSTSPHSRRLYEGRRDKNHEGASSRSARKKNIKSTGRADRKSGEEPQGISIQGAR